MTKEEYLKIAEKQWESLEKLKSETNFYDYEKKFDELMVGLGRELLEKNLGAVPLDRRKKKK
jgi:hypothetical protein